MKLLGTSLLLLLVTMVISSAHAACGGGGWHSSSTQVSQVAQASPNVVSSSEASHVVSTSVNSTPQHTNYSRPAAQSNLPNFNTSRFDSIAPKLNLSQKQSDRIQTAKQQVREDMDDLNRAYNRAEQRYAQCDGKCESEKMNLNRAAEAQRSFSPNVEFERRLQSILNDQQLATLHENDSTASNSR